MYPKQLFRRYGIVKQGDLVRLLTTEQKSNYIGKSETSVRSFLSQAMHGKRKLPESLLDSIVFCFTIKNRNLNKKKFKDEVRKSFTEVFEKFSNGGSEKKKWRVGLSSTNKDYDLLVKRTREASRIVVISAEPAEIKDNNMADELKLELLKKIGIVPSKNKRAKYEFYLAQGDETYSIPKSFWISLYKYGIALGIKGLFDKLKRANEHKGVGGLKVYVVPDSEIDVTHGIIDEGSQNPISFVTIYNKDPIGEIEEISVSRIEGPTLSRVLIRFQKIKEIQLKEYSFITALPSP